MNKQLVAIALLLTSTITFAGTWNLDTAHTKIEFKVKHLMISSVTGRFNRFKGTFEFDEKTSHLKDVKTEIVAESVDTNQPDRDKHLRSPDFLNVQKNPTLTFESTKIEASNGKPTKVHGKLTINGVTKEVTLDVKLLGTATVNNKAVLAFEARTEIQRKDFGLVWNKQLDKGGVAVGEEVTISIDGEANPAK